ncbi:MAG: LysR family transcriptional regulator [Betaproteobacteria bacterium RIFCSPLOWO2_12_FULL_67_28]|nr:MAG: LysR family transcriptional regulator [Betaproteobacteria bacterium RIFCSPLOWO2_12_FULL_67_28]
MLQSGIRRFLKHGTLPQLRVFEASARLGSLTRAAEELHIAQPTASVQIKKLTETVGLQLFEQVGRRVYLTDAGQRLYAGCHDVFRALSTLEATLNGMRSMESGHLRLAVCSTGKYFAPRMLGAFIQRYPGVEAALEIHNRKTLIDRLAGNEDDLYLFASPFDREDVVTQALLPNPLVVFARDDHPLANVRQIGFERIAAEPFLMRESGSGTRLLATQLFERRGLVPKVRLELNTDEAIKEAILAGLGVSIMSRFTLGLEPEPSRLICLDVEGFPLENNWHFAYPVGKQLSATARAFMDFARCEAKALVKGELRDSPKAGCSSKG